MAVVLSALESKAERIDKTINPPTTIATATKQPCAAVRPDRCGKGGGTSGGNANSGKPGGVPARRSKIVNAHPPAIGEDQSQQAISPSSERYQSRISLELSNLVQPGP